MKKSSIRSQLSGPDGSIPDPDLAGLEIVCFPMVLKKSLACYRSLEFRGRSEQILSRPGQILCCIYFDRDLIAAGCLYAV